MVVDKVEDIGAGMVEQGDITVELAGDGFRDWRGLLNLLHEAFEYQKTRIDPPSSLYRLDEKGLAAKAVAEQLVLAFHHGQLVGCVFARDEETFTYLGKLAVKTKLHGMGIGRRLVQTVDQFAPFDTQMLHEANSANPTNLRTYRSQTQQ